VRVYLVTTFRGFTPQPFSIRIKIIHSSQLRDDKYISIVSVWARFFRPPPLHLEKPRTRTAQRWTHLSTNARRIRGIGNRGGGRAVAPPRFPS
jgi:hypothetical protein